MQPAVQPGDVSAGVFGKQRGLGREADPRRLKTSRGCGFCFPGALGQASLQVVRLGSSRSPGLANLALVPFARGNPVKTRNACLLRKVVFRVQSARAAQVQRPGKEAGF